MSIDYYIEKYVKIEGPVKYAEFKEKTRFKNTESQYKTTLHKNIRLLC